jgi:hypothetical protein
MSHECPGPGCGRQVPGHMLMCRSHWYQVPPALRSAVWAAWDNGAGAGTAAHTHAITAAIESLGTTT